MNGLDRPPSSQGFTINPAATPINRPPSSQGFVLNPAATPINRPPSSSGRRTYMLPASPAPPSRYQAIIILVTFQFCMMIISWEPEDQYCMWPLGKVSENLPYNQWFAHFVVVVVVFLVKRKFLCLRQRSGRRHYVFGSSVPFCLCWYLKNREAVLHRNWYEGISWGDNTLCGFWGHRVKGQRSQAILC